MACVHSRVMAGNGRWPHACHCCDSGAPSAPWGAWSWPGRPLSNVDGVVAGVRPHPPKGEASPGAGAVPDRHVRQVFDLLARQRGVEGRSPCVAVTGFSFTHGPYASSAGADAGADGRRLDATGNGPGTSVPVSRSSGTTWMAASSAEAPAPSMPVSVAQ